MKTPEEIMEEAMNKTYEEIELMNIVIRESIRLYFSRKIADLGENGIINQAFLLEPPDSFGISDNQKPCVTRIEESNEGIITFNIADDGEYDFDNMDIDSLMYIAYQLKDQ